MNGVNYAIVAYVLGLSVMLGYAARLWWRLRARARAGRDDSQRHESHG